MGFCRLLRSQGIPVGLAEELDLARALHHVDALRRDDFYLVCRTALVKGPDQLAVFDALFAAYWGPDALPPKEAPDPGPPRVPDPLRDPTGDARTPWGTPASPRGRGDEAGPADPFRLMVYSPTAAQGERRMETLEREELARMRRLARRFRRWAATLRGRRYRPHHRGRVDFPRTVRASLRYGGEWVRLCRRQRAVARCRLVVLWDVSGSMEGHGPYLLGVLYALLRAVPSTRIFAFSTELEDLTPRFRGRPYRTVLREVSQRLRESGTGTRIGQCLAAFNRGYARLVDDRTTVLVVSDGWDLGDLDLLEEQLAILRRRSHRLLWVNPYVDRPDFRPEVAGMRRALPHIDRLIPPAAFAEREVYREHFGPGTT